MAELIYKTIEECRLDLVSFTVMREHPDDAIGGHSNDFMPCSAARVSFGNEDKTGVNPEADVKLMNYLAEHQHMTPFEYQHATFLIECPLFIRSQIHRHRAFSYNEISRRYTSEDLEFWIPDTFRGQSSSNRQASDGEASDQVNLRFAHKTACWYGLTFYETLLKGGVAREQARSVLPQALLTKFYMGGNLRSWAHFIELRSDEHAQAEIRVIANRIGSQLRDLWPNSCAALGL